MIGINSPGLRICPLNLNCLTGDYIYISQSDSSNPHSFSDRGTPDEYHHMHGYSGHTFKLVNEDGNFVYTQWHYRTDKTNAKAGELTGTNPDFDTQTLFEYIEKGEFPSWTVYVVRSFPYCTLEKAWLRQMMLFFVLIRVVTSSK